MNRVKTIKKLAKKRNLLQSIFSILFVVVIIGALVKPILFGYFLMFCVICTIAISPFLGRYWCNWCPRGSFLEKIWQKVSFKKEIPNFFKKTYFHLLIIVIFLSIIIINFISLYSSFKVVDALGITLSRVLLGSTFVALILGVFFKPRVWCTFCPGGTFAKISPIYKNKDVSLKIDTSLCINCHICYKVCPIEIDPSNYKNLNIISDNDCLKCSMCSEKCPTKALTF